MRHRKAGRKLNRSTDRRKALFKNLINALIIHGRIETTEAKAKAVKGLVDQVLARAKQGTVSARRRLTGFLGNQEAVRKAMDELAPGFRHRVSGFTRIVRLGRRSGDNASTVRMELVEMEKDEAGEKSKVGKRSLNPKPAKPRVKKVEEKPQEVKQS